MHRILMGAFVCWVAALLRTLLEFATTSNKKIHRQ